MIDLQRSSLRHRLPLGLRLLNINSYLLGVGLILVSAPLYLRWREEVADRRVATAVEWTEFRDFNARLAEPVPQMLAELRAQGASALVISPVTLSELLRQGRVQPLGPTASAEPLDVSRLRFLDAPLGRQVYQFLSAQNIPVQFSLVGKGGMISARPGTFVSLKDANLGFDPVLVAQTRWAGLIPVLRIFDDPWMSDDYLKMWLTTLPQTAPHLGVLFSTDEIPGGPTQQAFWSAWMRDNQVIQFLPEFRPARAAWLMAYSQPFNTFRAHSIPANELKDLKPDAQLSRWYRALEERSCRLLLVRMSASDSRESFFRSVSAVNSLVKRHQRVNSFPLPRLNWSTPGALQRLGAPFVAFAVICVVPALALATAFRLLPRWRFAFLKIVAACIAGALIAAAIAATPYTRVEILPFRGVKWGFIFSWALSLLALYDVKELRWTLYQYLRRSDLVWGGIAALLLGYLILRTGNAPAAFKVGWEQSLRDTLETALVARPRFKEFAIGYPLLWAGCYLQAMFRQRRSPWDGRLLIFLGMIGPISMINTFCHLHSPIYLEIWRSINGVVLGVLIGAVVVWLIRRRLSDRPQISLPFAEGEALYYQRLS